ncbi:MAG: 2OG-Fe(II) oxygenase [Proteobacteria bacterium]|jgi:hypothetical protein|nr:2OG-Fe(II) oxygenase [Pseudomonadota bacterium]MBK8960475.1 2OG-Fe(II) oxygenase [Pseudomonadota bacterium]
MSAMPSLLPSLLPATLHEALWTLVQRPCWLFGNVSTPGGSLPFWKMDLDGEALIDEAWRHAQPLCEGLAQRPLRIVRVYANGHTFGQGGQAHKDDLREGTYTLLYYPMPEWRREWEGETVFYERDDVLRAWLPAPNRALFFDSRIEHAGRPPSRAFGGLRVTIAFKLEVPR